MQKRRLLNLQPSRQAELNLQYSWLKAIHEDERPAVAKVLSVSVFDHWLSREDACSLLENVPPEVQALRDSLHAKFCALLVSKTTVLSFVFRRRSRDRLVFREFTSRSALSQYCTTKGGRTLGHRHFCVALPDLNCVYYESWDSTNHFFFTDPSSMGPLYDWAQESGLHLLAHG